MERQSALRQASYDAEKAEAAREEREKTLGTAEEQASEFLIRMGN